mmetsp:Transcript_28852/g.92932  ORF Transcript_28852/g.92932 Transcript_28852/m.92932 type:complete len:178 (-) Transcript_28852:269-802(-)|eukprot:CAMPEP_0118890730 /NCGR_PEP_ID=MMETSP1166-20130328/1055_1 /TAXON_ID=1104430 /ORGANISM="Chrysoreinhardia sp, Strain CCMP3193" /LENGTH=177 /DNA_ID=CAMNT_0006829349 /DNA_START=229 /DNA_END=762 /DNA_ORIENTATION=-
MGDYGYGWEKTNDYAAPGQPGGQQEAAPQGISPPLPQQRAAGGQNLAVLWAFRAINVGLATMMAATGALSFKQFGNLNGNQLTQIFVALYLLLLASVWFTFEVSQIKPMDFLTFQLKRNFGFLFHPMGKSLFIIFVAFLNFGVQEKTLGLVTGILCLADGIILIALYLKYPEWYPLE